MVAINRKNDLMVAMYNWVVKENQVEIGKKNGVNLGTMFFYIISSNPKKWVGEYGRAGYHGSTSGKILVRDKGEERIAARILNFPGDRLVHRVDSFDTESDIRYIYIFDGDWIKVCPGLYYSKELDNYYWTGDRFDNNTWHGSEWSEKIKAYIADYSNSYYSTSHFWDWCEEHYPEEPEEVDLVLENKKEFIANTIRTISQSQNNIIGKDLWWQNGDGVHYIGYWRRNDEIILEFSEVDIDEVYNALSDVNTGVSIEYRACGYVFGIGWEE